jgi:hypothetical protein
LTCASPWPYLMFMLAFGISFSGCTCRIIYAHIVSKKFPLWWWQHPETVPLFVFSLAVNLLDANVVKDLELRLLSSWLVISSLSFGYWTYHMINSMCVHLGIECLRIRYRPKRS